MVEMLDLGKVLGATHGASFLGEPKTRKLRTQLIIISLITITLAGIIRICFFGQEGEDYQD